jgi:hypothetical protein
MELNSLRNRETCVSAQNERDTGMVKYVDFEKQANGDLRIILQPETREDVEDIAVQEWTADQKLSEVIEYQLGNGWSWVNPEAIASLTDAPILSEQVETDDDGTVTHVGEVYWYPQYEVTDPVQQLLRDGFVVFERGSDK